MKQPLTKAEIYKNMLEICQDNTILQHQKIEEVWTINSLIYCLELLNYDYGIYTDINTIHGTYIPIRRYNDQPIFVPATTRANKAIIVDVESYPINMEDEETNYIYLFVIEEV